MTFASRVAMISLHTSPLDQPGTGDSGGMNVYLRALAPLVAQRGIAVDILTRRSSPAQRTVVLGEGVRVLHVEAGPAAPVPKPGLDALVPEFVHGAVARAAIEGLFYDAIHAHYWLSGVAGLQLAERWRIPLVASFHTLGRVKRRALGPTSEPQSRLRGEALVVRSAARLLAPTAAEVEVLKRLYGADPELIRLAPPGVDVARFHPGDGASARARLGLEGRRVILFAGRLQEAKAPDVAVRAVAALARRRPDLDPILVVTGGPSGEGHQIDVTTVAAREAISDRMLLHPPVPHRDMPELYRAADVVVVPSRTESFGLVALEAQACGIPVVAAAVGGLPAVVRDRATGLLVAGHRSEDHARAVEHILDGLGGRLGPAAARWAARWTWNRTADRVVDAYRELAAAGEDRVALPAG